MAHLNSIPRKTEQRSLVAVWRHTGSDESVTNKQLETKESPPPPDFSILFTSLHFVYFEFFRVQSEFFVWKGSSTALIITLEKEYDSLECGYLLKAPDTFNFAYEFEGCVKIFCLCSDF